MAGEALDWHKTAFVKPDGSVVTIRLNSYSIKRACCAAKDLKARWIIMSVPWHKEDCWGVFDMRRAQENNPIPGAWVVEEPIRTFSLDTFDAAVMYAVAQLGR